MVILFISAVQNISLDKVTLKIGCDFESVLYLDTSAFGCFILDLFLLLILVHIYIE
jgi:hypothetical protein